MKYKDITFNETDSLLKGYLDIENFKGEIIFYEKFIKSKKSKKLYDNILKNLPLEQGTYNMFGKEVKTPRLLWAVRDKDFDIKKSYQITESSTWNKKIEKIKTKVEKVINKKIKYAQINYYRNGDDYIGWHTDSEVIEGDLIASLSLGVSRKFQFKSISKKEQYEIELTDGSLIIFDESAAKLDWKHRIPKQKNINEGRINLTFRLR
jgi:alkylated DNA repair dioxygenase AlkB